MAFLQTLKSKIKKGEKPRQAPPARATETAEKSRETRKTISLEEKAEIAEVLAHPHITEKSSYLANSRIYTFRAAPRATKRRVKDAVERLYGVEVSQVRMVTVPAKARMRGRLEGTKRGYRKALVRLAEGNTIAEFLQH